MGILQSSKCLGMPWNALGIFFAISLGEKQHVAVAVSLAANICQLTSQFVGYTMLHLKHPQIHPQ